MVVPIGLKHFGGVVFAFVMASANFCCLRMVNGDGLRLDKG